MMYERIFLAALEAVSYTHLDVYKRQVHGVYGQGFDSLERVTGRKRK